jgi:hypothetical protein
MKRLFLLFVAVVLVAAPGFAQATTATKTEKKAEKAEKKAAAPKVQTAMGKVTAVAADSVTVKGKDAEWTFAVDKATDVLAKGATHKSATMKAESTPVVITDFVHVGDDVTVKYHDMGATKHAASVSVRNSGAAATTKKK